MMFQGLYGSFIHMGSEKFHLFTCGTNGTNLGRNNTLCRIDCSLFPTKKFCTVTFLFS